MARILVALFILGFLELTVLLWLASQMGWLFALAEIIMTMVLGLAIIRWEGVRVMFDFRQRLVRGDHLGDAVLDTVMLFLGAILLIVPGLITDFVGLLLLIPPSRNLLKPLVVWHFYKGSFPERSAGTSHSVFFSTDESKQSDSEEVIDVEFHRVSERW